MGPMGTGRRGPGAYRPPTDMWEMHKGRVYWATGILVVIVLGIWAAEWTLLADA